MSLEENTKAIIRLAWSRRMGLEDDALDPAPDPGADGPSRIEVDRGDGELGLLQLLGHTVLVGPGELLRAAREHADDQLNQISTWPSLLAAAGLGAVRLGEPELLLHLDDYRSVSGSPLISDEAAAASALADRCPPDDRIGLDLAGLPTRFVLLDEDDRQRPVAAAGYAESGGLLGRLQVLTARSHRGRGLGATVAAVAANDALDAGLIVEGFVPIGNRGAMALSESVGLSRSGCRIWSA